MRRWKWKHERNVTRLKRLISMGLAFALLGSAVQAQEPESMHAAQRWQASYWNNTQLLGTAVWTESVDYLSFNWGYGSPHPSVSTDGFSVRWSRYVDLAEATYRFAVTSDDGVRVYVDGRLIIDQWYDHAARTFSSDLAVKAGLHHMMVEYYESTGVALLGFSWQPVPVQPDHWHGEYFDNPRLSGAPVLLRSDAQVAFDWGYGSPAAAIPSDGFSARWTRLVYVDGGRYRFTVASDDGVRLYVDRRLVIDQWRDQGAQAHTAYLDLSAGDHLVVLEYYENGGVAIVRLSWSSLPGGPRVWRGEYYGNPWLAGSPFERDDPLIQFDWGWGSPAPRIPSDGFSVRWTRTEDLAPALYRFTTQTDDGVRLWVNGHLLIDRWHDQALSTHSATMYVAGETLLEMEYYERSGIASARFHWTVVEDGSPSPAGTVVVDDGDVGFVRGGAPSSWRTSGGGYDGSFTWTRNNDRARLNYNWARWYPHLEAGRYEVFVYVPNTYATTAKARYWISHRGGYMMRLINQATSRGLWVSLGLYEFRGTSEDYISLADATYEPWLSRHIAFDAVKWVPR